MPTETEQDYKALARLHSEFWIIGSRQVPARSDSSQVPARSDSRQVPARSDSRQVPARSDSHQVPATIWQRAPRFL